CVQPHGSEQSAEFPGLWSSGRLYLLDTNTCIYIINLRPPGVFERFHQHPAGTIGVSSITAAELQFGVTKSGSTRNQAALDRFLLPLEVMPFNLETAIHYGMPQVMLEQSGSHIGPLDTLIAAHALSLGAVLVTNNLREFQGIEKLGGENWL
ncbi:MAG: type II toxin-antitoxin system VapC family toxin, partial [Chromatiaceae bacterium]